MSSVDEMPKTIWTVWAIWVDNTSLKAAACSSTGYVSRRSNRQKSRHLLRHATKSRREMSPDNLSSPETLMRRLSPCAPFPVRWPLSPGGCRVLRSSLMASRNSWRSRVCSSYSCSGEAGWGRSPIDFLDFWFLWGSVGPHFRFGIHFSNFWAAFCPTLNHNHNRVHSLK